MTAVQRVAIAGAGVAGTAAAILLAEGGVEVDLFESKPEVSALGSGISLQGNALRVFDQLGIWEKAKEKGYPFDGVAIRAPGPDAQILAQVPDHRAGGPNYPASMGMYRPDLAQILVDRATEVGVRIHFGTTVTGVTSDETGVDVATSDGETRRYDLLVGADGLHSKVRSLIGIDITPRRTGMGIWRAFVKRPKSVTTSELYYGGPCYIAGYTPTGEDTMYAFLVEKAQDRSGVGEQEAVEIMKGLSQAYGGPWNEIRDDLSTASRVNYTWFTEHILPEPWNRGRVVLIGEAAHSCPPTIAQGAAQAVEDAAVLAELLLRRDEVDDELWKEFHARRFARAKAVVEASTQVGQWQLDGVRDADVPGLLRNISRLVAEPA